MHLTKTEKGNRTIIEIVTETFTITVSPPGNGMPGMASIIGYMPEEFKDDFINRPDQGPFVDMCHELGELLRANDLQDITMPISIAMARVAAEQFMGEQEENSDDNRIAGR